MFETMPIDDGLCAVEGCDERGRPQVCPYDQRYHRHGCIHYENDHPFHPEMRFKSGAWRRICDPHYATIAAGAVASGRVSAETVGR